MALIFRRVWVIFLLKLGREKIEKFETILTHVTVQPCPTIFLPSLPMMYFQ